MTTEHSPYWLVLSGAGALLSLWALRSLPEGTSLAPVPVERETEEGPYGLMKHPMYLGNALFIAGLGGYAAGTANALALGAVTDLVQRHWIQLENGDA